MKTLQELYNAIMGSDELKKAFAEAAKDGKVADFLKANGCEATAEEVKAFIQEKASQPLSDEELDNAAGGACNDKTGGEVVASIATAGLGCLATAIMSAAIGYNGQEGQYDGRICNY